MYATCSSDWRISIIKIPSLFHSLPLTSSFLCYPKYKGKQTTTKSFHEKEIPKAVWPIVFLCLLKLILQDCPFYLAVDKNNKKSCNFDAAANFLIQQHEKVCMELSNSILVGNLREPVGRISAITAVTPYNMQQLEVFILYPCPSLLIRWG